jgi:hypothetical protein
MGEEKKNKKQRKETKQNSERIRTKPIKDKE